MSSQSNVTIGPIAPENNPPINPQYFQPSVFYISAITLGKTTLVTTSVDHNYVVGNVVRLVIPPTYGARELNEQQGLVVSIPSSTQVVLDIYSSFGNPFIPSPAYGPTLPQIKAIGDNNSGGINSSGRINNNTTILGSFINISPL